MTSQEASATSMSGNGGDRYGLLFGRVNGLARSRTMTIQRPSLVVSRKSSLGILWRDHDHGPALLILLLLRACSYYILGHLRVVRPVCGDARRGAWRLGAVEVKFLQTRAQARHEFLLEKNTIRRDTGMI